MVRSKISLCMTILHYSIELPSKNSSLTNLHKCIVVDDTRFTTPYESFFFLSTNGYDNMNIILKMSDSYNFAHDIINFCNT